MADATRHTESLAARRLRLVPRRSLGVVRLLCHDTGEVKEWRMGGVDPGLPWDGVIEVDPCAWEKSSLELALDLVPTLVEAIERGRRDGGTIHVGVTQNGS